MFRNASEAGGRFPTFKKIVLYLLNQLINCFLTSLVQQTLSGDEIEKKKEKKENVQIQNRLKRPRFVDKFFRPKRGIPREHVIPWNSIFTRTITRAKLRILFIPPPSLPPPPPLIHPRTRIQSTQEVIQGRVHSNTYGINPNDEREEE